MRFVFDDRLLRGHVPLAGMAQVVDAVRASMT
jgi:hypothetical protein